MWTMDLHNSAYYYKVANNSELYTPQSIRKLFL